MIIKLAFAFGAGFISFLTPCVLPIIPGYISYITGKSLNEIEQDKKIVLIKTVLFSIGFSFTIFIQALTIISSNFIEIRGRIGFDSKVLCRCKHAVRCIISTLI